jgi:hypothetical protein
MLSGVVAPRASWRSRPSPEGEEFPPFVPTPLAAHYCGFRNRSATFPVHALRRRAGNRDAARRARERTRWALDPPHPWNRLLLLESLVRTRFVVKADVLGHATRAECSATSTARSLAAPLPTAFCGSSPSPVAFRLSTARRPNRPNLRPACVLPSSLHATPTRSRSRPRCVPYGPTSMNGSPMTAPAWSAPSPRAPKRRSCGWPCCTGCSTSAAKIGPAHLRAALAVWDYAGFLGRRQPEGEHSRLARGDLQEPPVPGARAQAARRHRRRGLAALESTARGPQSQDRQQRPRCSRAHARTAARWKVIDRAPCSVTMRKLSAALPKFYDFDEYKRLVEAARALDSRTHLVVLLGGDAGLRRGETMALRWTDVDFRRRQLQVEEAVWERKRPGGQGHERITDTPKGGRRASCRSPTPSCTPCRHTATCEASPCSSGTTGVPPRASLCAGSTRARRRACRARFLERCWRHRRLVSLSNRNR